MTTEPRFLQIHTLTPYAAALLNRDDVGMAKRLPFGGSERVRVSSQCLKRHWRRATDDWSLTSLGGPDALAVRSREIFPREIAPVLAAEGFDPARIVAVLEALKAKVLGESAKAKKDKDDKAEKGDKTEKGAVSPDEAFKSLKTEQVIVLGQPEIAFITAAARTLLKDGAADKDPAKAVEAWLKDKANKANLEALKRAAGLDAALFGRMVTSDILARGDAAVHVAHAFTVHRSEAEPDYFTAVDDLVQAAGELGSGHINQTELTSGLFYSYVVVDLPLLVSNLEGCRREDWRKADRTLAGRVVEHLIHLIASVSPGAKLGSTAPYAYAELVLVEAGARQPRSLANAFLKPVALKRDGDLRADAIAALGGHLAKFDAMYANGREQRRVAALDGAGTIGADPAAGLDDLAAWAGALAAGRTP